MNCVAYEIVKLHFKMRNVRATGAIINRTEKYLTPSQCRIITFGYEKPYHESVINATDTHSVLIRRYDLSAQPIG